jgi:eukaryotic-like serine/threonine-protein kinase
MKSLLPGLSFVLLFGAGTAATGQEPLTLKGHTDIVRCVAFSPDGKKIVSGGDDNRLKVWDAASGQETLTLKGHTDRVWSVAFSPDGKKIVSGSEDKTLKVWDATGVQGR